MAYRSFGRFRQASTHLDTPPSSLSHHPISDLALTPEVMDSCSGEAFRDAVPVQGACYPADAGAAGARLRSPGHPWVLVASAGAASSSFSPSPPAIRTHVRVAYNGGSTGLSRRRNIEWGETD